ncbi:hypothetical protein VPH35_016713 [Triticum aestivum]
MILRGSTGDIIFLSCRELRTCTEPLEAGLSACMEGNNLALHWTEMPIEVETDCLFALNMINGPDRERSRYTMLVDQIQRLLREERMFKLSHVHREQNGASHYLASFERTEGRTVVWLGSGPGDVPDICKNDLCPD